MNEAKELHKREDMDSEDGRDSKSSRDKDDEHIDPKEQFKLQTLAILAAKATAKIKVTQGHATNANAAPTPRTTTSTSAENATTTVNQAVIAQLGPESNDKPLSQKSDDSDCTLQSDQSESNALKAFAAAQAAEDKTFAGEQTLDRILLAHSEQAITTARVELDCNGSCTTHERMLQAGSGVVIKSLTAARDGALAAAAEGGDTACGVTGSGERAPDTTPTGSVRSIGSLVCRICHNSENPERLVSPCLCKGSLTYVHIHCLERWISTSRSTICELCQFQYNTVQTLRYTCFQSLRMWYSRSMSRRALQEDCQMFSLLTLVAFGIIGTLLVGIQYYFLQGQAWGLSRMWTKGWLIFFLFTTLAIYFVNIYMILKSQLSPWYRWWQASRDIKLILENRKPFQFRPNRRVENVEQDLSDRAQLQQQYQPQDNTGTAPPFAPIAPQAAFTPTPQQPYQPIQLTTAGISGIRTRAQASAYQLPMSINSIELQCSECNNSDADNDDSWQCYGKRPPAKATSRGVTVAMHCSKLTTAATIEIPLEGCLCEFETVL